MHGNSSYWRDSRRWIDQLGLIPHPEGGFFRQTYSSDLALTALPPRFSGPRPASTAILFLIDGENFSALHRLQSDELWHFYAGGRLIVHVISENGDYSELHLGSNPEAGESFQATVRAGCWFGSRVADPTTFALVGCTVSPGFDFADFELARRDSLTAQFPQHAELIRQLTRA